MNRKIVIWLLTAVLLTAVSLAQAQQPRKVPRIGLLSTFSPRSDYRIDAFLQGLHELGYIEGQNISLEYRWAEGRYERLPDLAAELVRLKVDVIVTHGKPGAPVAKQTTSTIPVVFVNVSDPVGDGLVASLARPGGNITGLANFGVETASKRLELLKETVPKVARVAVLWNPGNPGGPLQLREMEAAAPALHVQLQPIEVRDPNEFDSAFSAMIRKRADALAGMGDAMFNTHRTRIVDFAAKNRLPAMHPGREYVEAGGLMSYGASVPDGWRRAATYVDKILKGAKPADLPVEQPMKFEFIINLKTAKQIGLTIPPNVLARADKVIK